MRYNYTCTKDPRCRVKDVPEALQEKLVICVGDCDNASHQVTSQSDLSAEDRPPPNTDPKEAHLVWEEEHAMFAEVAIKCPVCGSSAAKSFNDYYFTGYIRGNGYLDRAGCMRDMSLYKLKKEDPYSQYRVTGEVEDLESRLRRGGRYNPNTKYFSK